MITDGADVTASLAGLTTGASDESDFSLRVIADHIRACAFLVADGVLPSNEGRGYVLRRIIRRAVRHGFMLGQKKPFFHQMVEPLARAMGEFYPVLADDCEKIAGVLEDEEKRFARTLDTGLGILQKVMDQAGSGGGAQYLSQGAIFAAIK